MKTDSCSTPFFIVLALWGLFCGGIARADIPVWTGATGTEWSTASNWTPSVVPGSTSNVRINVNASGIYPLISQNATYAISVLNIGYTASSNSSAWATLNMTAGSLTTTNAYLGTNSRAQLNLSGATINVVNATVVGGAVYPGRVDIIDGTLLARSLTVNPGSNIDLSGSGMLQIASASTQIQKIYTAVEDGRISSWNGRGVPVPTYNATTNTVVITAGPEPDMNAAYHPEPENGAMDVGLQATLAWSPGDDAVTHKVYLGTDPANLSLVATQSATSVTGSFQADTDYYWRVDEILSGGSVVMGPIWKFTPTTPRSFWGSQPVNPGKIALVQGVGFANVRVQVAQLAAGTGSPNVAAATAPHSSQPILTDAATLGALAWTDAQVVQQSSSTIHFKIPATFTAGVYAYKVTSRDGNNQNILTSAIYLLNVPQQTWVLGDRGTSATPGGMLRVTGNCMAFSSGGTPAIALVNDSNQIVRTISASAKGQYSNQFAVPSDLPPGSYRLWVSNGHGGSGGWQLCQTKDFDLSQTQTFSFQPAPVAGSYSYTMNPDSPTLEADFAAALAAATAANGGTIHFPAGTYAFSKGYTVPDNTTITGAGRDATTLAFSNGTKIGSDWYELILKNNTILQDATITALGFSSVVVAAQSNTTSNVTIRRIGTLQNQTAGSNVGIALRGSGGIVENCVLNGCISGIQLRYADHARVVGNTVNALNGPFGCMTVNGVIAENNTLTVTRDGLSDAGNGMTVYGDPCSQNVYFANNTAGAAPGLSTMSQWTTDGADGIYFGFADRASSGATTGSITLAGPLLTHRSWPGKFGVFVVAGRGAGQWRRVLSHVDTSSSSTLMLDRPWDIDPDSSSIVTAVAVIGKAILHNNRFTNCSTYLDAYQVAVDYIMADNTITLQSDTTRGECQASGGGHNSALMPCWHYQLLNNDLRRGNLLFGVSCKGVSNRGPNYSWYTDGSLLYDFVCRGNRTNAESTASSLILGTVSGYASFFRLTGGLVEDCLLPLGKIGNVENLFVGGRSWFQPQNVPITDGLLFQIDASNSLSVERDFNNLVTCWWNVAPAGGSGVGGCAVPGSTGNSSPGWAMNQLNGLPVVDFGASGSGRWMQFKDPDGADLNLVTIRTVFWVMKGANFLLGDDNSFHFHRPVVPLGNPANPLWEVQNASTYVKNGKTYLNGTQIDGTTTPLPLQYSVISLVTTGNVQASRLCIDRNYMNRTGGQQIAEILIYNRALTDAERLQVEAYLGSKWMATQ